MDDLIYRWSAIDALTDTNLKRNLDSVCDGDMNRTRRAAQRVIAQLPAVDAVDVVMCKDCLWRGDDNVCTYLLGKTMDDFYCKMGEKRRE